MQDCTKNNNAQKITEMPNVNVYMSRIKSLLLVIEKEIQKDDSFTNFANSLFAF